MNVLIMGNLKQISTGFFSKIKQENKCVVYGVREQSEQREKDVIRYFCDDNDDSEIQKIFATFDFEAVIYFSKALDGAVKVYDELEKLESAIYTSRKYAVKNFIYITTNDNLATNKSALEGQSRKVLLSACNSLCKTIAQEERIAFLILYVPYLYNLHTEQNQLMQWISAGNKGDEIYIRGSEFHETDFLCDEDLGELIARVLDEPMEKNYEEMFLSGNNVVTMQELSQYLARYIRNAKIVFGNQNVSTPIFHADKKARSSYGWFPKHILADDIKQLAIDETEKRNRQIKQKKRRERYRNLREKMRIVGETLGLVFLAEILDYYTKNNVLINFIDFRLVSTTIIGTMNGFVAGVLAAIFSSIGHVLLNVKDVQWQILFYNVENWLPFACYFLLGAISGYTRDKHDDNISNVRDEQKLLEQKYVFLNELYNKVLENKDSFTSQIIGYKDSFGKIYSVVKKLDAVLPDQVFFEAINTLEELLENYYVAIFTVNSVSDFARLNVCSKTLNNSLNRSLKMSDYPKMMEYLMQGKEFKNIECYEHYPAYAAPIMRNSELAGMILLMNCTNNQMNMEFANKFSIISDLISNALIRAIGFEQVSDQYLENTQILKPERFKEILNVKAQMQEKQYFEYILLHIYKENYTLEELSERICHLVRSNDVLGMGEDGEIYLILSQTRYADLAIIDERMRKNGIRFEVVKG